MNQSNDIKTHPLLTGLLLGIIAGGLLGIAFAPARGRETRRKFFDLLEALKDEEYAAKHAQDTANSGDPENNRPV